MNIQQLTDTINNLYYNDSSSYKVIQSKQKELLSYFKPHTNIKRIDTTAINKFYLYLKQQDNKPATIKTKLAYLSRAINYAYALGEIEKKPVFPTVKLKAVKDRFLTRDELAAMYHYCRQHPADEYKELLNIIIISKNTGQRISEVLTFDSETSVDHNYWRIWQNKTDTPHSVPLNNKLLRRIRQYHIRFTINYQKAYYLFRNMCKALNITGVTIHTLRHTAASTLVEKGVSIYEIKELLNHKQIATTQRYLHLKRDTLEKTVSML